MLLVIISRFSSRFSLFVIHRSLLVLSFCLDHASIRFLRTVNGEQRQAALGTLPSAHCQFIRRFQRRSAASADYSRAIAAGQRIGNFRRTHGTVENHGWLMGFGRGFRSDLHEQGTVTQFADSATRAKSSGRGHPQAQYAMQAAKITQAVCAESNHPMMAAARRETARPYLSSVPRG